MDSAYRHLVIGLYENDVLICGTMKEAFKKQSEELFVELVKWMEEANWQSDDIDEVIIADGPGSYTGLRIAMSVAKVLCTQKKIPLYAISTLQLYAGLHKHSLVLLDARSSRAYVGILDQGELKEEKILTIDEIEKVVKSSTYTIFGDGELINSRTEKPDFLTNFIALRPYYRKIDNIHTYAPRYLKDQAAYKI